MFYPIFFSPNLIFHVSAHFLQSTLYCSCFISFSPKSISFILSAIVHLVHVYIIWLHSNYIVIQPYCQFPFSTNPSRMWILTTYRTLDKVLILDRLDRYSLLEAELRLFYCSLFLYIKQEMQQWGITFYETKLATNKRKL